MAKYIELGTTCKDVITGFTGVAIGRVSHITGCDRYELQPKMEGTTIPDSAWVDVNRLEVIADVNVIKLSTDTDIGGGNVPHGRVL